MKLTDEEIERSKILGVSYEEYEWFKYLYNNVSIVPEEILTDFGRPMYKKMAKAIVKKLDQLKTKEAQDEKNN